MSVSQTSENSIGILPGRAVSSFAITLPPLATSKLNKALPHIMADYLADDRGETSFCIVDTAQDGKALVLACDTDILCTTLNDANEDKRNLTAIWPDYMRLAIPESGAAIRTDGTDILARRADGTGFRLPRALADIALENETTCDAVETEFPTHLAGFATGRFGPNLPLAQIVKKARTSLALTALAGLMWSASLAFQGWQNDSRRFALEDQAIAQYKEQFPKARRVVNVEAQLRGKLGTSAGARGFSGIMASIQNVLTAQGTARLEELSYAALPNPSLKLVIATPGFSELEQLRSKLKAAGFRLSGGSSEQVNGFIRNEITLTPIGRR